MYCSLLSRSLLSSHSSNKRSHSLDRDTTSINDSYTDVIGRKLNAKFFYLARVHGWNERVSRMLSTPVKPALFTQIDCAFFVPKSQYQTAQLSVTSVKKPTQLNLSNFSAGPAGPLNRQPRPLLVTISDCRLLLSWWISSVFVPHSRSKLLHTSTLQFLHIQFLPWAKYLTWRRRCCPVLIPLPMLF